jgi:hypothetical protein
MAAKKCSKKEAEAMLKKNRGILRKIIGNK